MLHLTPMIIVLILTAKSVAGLDIRVRIILKQHKLYNDYLNLPNFLSETGILQNIPQISILC